ncbi:hypothetical protein [Natrinema longum]|uniref:Uncharacterized protein n=1 Tax=Natrinema longum TaxID=370324 RepID=A0A8A2UEP4_9EURY|nr:hypothetical protein [Natrinema longum]MBZ6494847.1 hypothetical protein [Natrinema longum]QSW86984.1 hypothetical protein J0X27_10215 [Natrinema longum]
MDGLITGENDERVGLSVIDNDDVEHVIELEFDGEIKYHESDYPEPKQATDEQEERINQACRFAQYYVFVERGYDTVPASENPVRIDAVRQAINEMDSAEFEDLFGDLYQQLEFEEGSGTSPAMTVPSGATDPCIYCKNIYLGIDPLETDLGTQLASKHDLDVTKSAAEIDLADVSEHELESWGEFSGEFAAQAADSGLNLSDAAYIDETSDLYVKYPDGAQLAVVDDHLAPAARDPDTVIELLPIDPQDLEYFKSFMDHYLRCQIRDSFVEMGVHPPEEFQVIGMGRFMAARGYDYIDFYPELHNPNAKAFQ